MGALIGILGQFPHTPAGRCIVAGLTGYCRPESRNWLRGTDLLVTELGCTSHAAVRPCRDSATRF
eukprot:3110170-Prymnesium_polylepis.1